MDSNGESSNKNCLEMEHISKSFFGVNVLKDINFYVAQQEIHALIGENGAGKSTLMKILGGVHARNGGTVRFQGAPVEFKTPLDALKAGICMVHQEISLAPTLDITTNIFLGAERARGAFLNLNEMRKIARDTMHLLGVDVSVSTPVNKLSIAQQQLVEIARALVFNAKLIILDEPTAAISENEVQELFRMLRKLKEQGVSIIYISHRMDEIFQIADSVSVMRDGVMIHSGPTSGVTRSELISMMVGRKVDEFYGDAERPTGQEVILEVSHFTNKRLKDVSFDLRKGEILGFAGLVGAGRTEMARALFGIDKLSAGEIKLYGEVIKNRNPREAMQHGFGLIPEDRKEQGLHLFHSIETNVTLLVLDAFIHGCIVNRKKKNEIVSQYANSLSIAMSSPKQLVSTLSGGNQQKVSISKWLARGCKILIMDEPTRGVDVGAKSEIYSLMRKLTDEGYTIIMISSELPEIINICSRVVVMHEGEVTHVFDAAEEELTQEKIMYYAVGGYSDEGEST